MSAQTSSHESAGSAVSITSMVASEVSILSFKQAPPWSGDEELRGLAGKLDVLLETQSDLLQEPDRGVVVRRGDRDDAVELEDLAAVGEHRLRRLDRVAPAPEARQEGEADVHVFERVALDEAAQPRGFARLLQLDRPQA